MAKTLADGLQYLRQLLSSVEGGKWTATELPNYINTAQKDVALKLPDELLLGLVSTQDTTLQEDINEVAHPTRYYRFIGGWRKRTDEDRKRKIEKVDYPKIIELEAEIVYPEQMYLTAYLADLGDIFYLYPEGETDETMTIKYCMSPSDMTELTDEFSVDDLVYEWVIYYASALACLKDFQARATSFLQILDKKIQEASLIYRFKPPSPFAPPVTQQQQGQ